MSNRPKSCWRRFAALVLGLLLAGCLAENEHTIITNPVDLKPFEGYWIGTKGETAQMLGITPTAAGANLTYVFMRSDTQQADFSQFHVQATKIDDVLYFELTGTTGADKAPPTHHTFGRVSFGSPETPHDRDKLTVCFAESAAMKDPVQKGDLKGTIVKDRSGALIPDPDKVRITNSTAELRAYLAANPLKCSPFSWYVFVRAQPHLPTFPVRP